MKYLIELASNWRADGRIFHPGQYRIPEDMSEELAERAVSDSCAVKQGTKVKGAAPENKGNRGGTVAKARS